MLWLLILHITALIIWCASLLYLPALIAGIHTKQIEIVEPYDQYGSIARFVLKKGDIEYCKKILQKAQLFLNSCASANTLHTEKIKALKMLFISLVPSATRPHHAQEYSA
jgi:hypothetical protein